MAKKLLRILFILIAIITVLYFIPYLVRVARNPIRDDILDFGPILDTVLESLGVILFLVAEYGVYSGLKYLLFEKKKNVTRIVWEVFKIMCSIIVFLDLTKIYEDIFF